MSDSERLARAIKRFSAPKSREIKWDGTPNDMLTSLLEMIDNIVLERRVRCLNPDGSEIFSALAGNRRLYWVSGTMRKGLEGTINDMLANGLDPADGNELSLLRDWLTANFEGSKGATLSVSRHSGSEAVASLGVLAETVADSWALPLHRKDNELDQGKVYASVSEGMGEVAGSILTLDAQNAVTAQMGETCDVANAVGLVEVARASHSDPQEVALVDFDVAEDLVAFVLLSPNQDATFAIANVEQAERIRVVWSYEINS